MQAPLATSSKKFGRIVGRPREKSHNSHDRQQENGLGWRAIAVLWGNRLGDGGDASYPRPTVNHQHLRLSLIIVSCVQLGRSGGKSKQDAQVGVERGVSGYIKHDSTSVVHLATTAAAAAAAQKELERQERYPNLLEPHKLKILLVRLLV